MNDELRIKTADRGEIVIYQPPEGGGPTLNVRLDRETVWLDAHQMAALSGRDRTVIVRHIRNVYATGELAREATCAKNAQVAADDKVRQMDIYNLDMILSVGYRVNSKRGTQFRIWATSVLREHLVRGVTINRQRIETNAREIEAALELARRAVASPQLTTDMGRRLVEVIARYTQTFLLLQRYDEGLLTEPKALHLLYFIIKNHPFADGNKRIGAMLFVEFLNRNSRLILPSGEAVINDIGLAALALLIAESNPKDKDVLIRLIMNMLTRKQ